MFLAIINDSYVEVKAELARRKEGEGILDWFMNKIRGLGKRGQNPDVPDKEATYEEFKIMLYRAGYAEKDIDEAFVRFNVGPLTNTVPDAVASEIAEDIAKTTDYKKQYMENHRDYSNMNRRVDQMHESLFTITERLDHVTYCLHKIDKKYLQQMDGGNLVDLNSLLTENNVRNREATRRPTLTPTTEKKEE